MSLLFDWMLDQVARVNEARSRALDATLIQGTGGGMERRGVISPHCEASDAARHAGADSMLDFAIREVEKKQEASR